MNKQELAELQRLRRENAESKTKQEVSFEVGASIQPRQNAVGRMKSLGDKTPYEQKLEEDLALKRADEAKQKDEQKMREAREAGVSRR